MSDSTPCTDCGQRLPKAPEVTLEDDIYELNYKAASSSIMTKFGRTQSIMQPLVAPYGKPKGGWYVNVKVKGIPHTVNHTSPISVFNEVKSILNANSLTVKDLDLWLNLNIQWYGRLPDKFQLVRHDDLLAVATTSDVKTVHDPKDRRYTPADWGSTAWDFMGRYLAQDVYIWDEFWKLLETVQRMLNNDINPSIGCNDCYIEFTKELSVLKNNPKHTLESAREWLFNSHNAVNKRLNKPQFIFDAAAKRYLWK